MTATRRLAAILAADVAGYSRLIGSDEEGTLERLKAIRAEVVDPKIGEHRGRIVKTTGDGLLVEFASVVDALRCASEWQAGMAERNAGLAPVNRIEFRIGVHQGDIVVDDDDIFGDGVNVAARLEGLADPGGICVSARVQEDAAGRLDLTFEDMGEQALKNIARSVRVYRVRLDGTENTPKAAPAEIGPVLALPDKPSIAVLPFQNMSGDPEQDYFADGMVEEIITALSRIRWLFVIARNSTFTYKGQAVDVKQVGRELGVRYVLEGSVRKGGNRVRITAQLIDALTGAHLWADRFDGSLEDVFDLQDQVAANVAGVIEPALQAAEVARARAKRPENLAAYDLYLRALPELRPITKEGIDRALGFLRRAIEIEPGYAAALAQAAFCYSFLRVNQWMADEDGETAEGVRLAKEAIVADREEPTALVNAGYALWFLGRDADAAISALDRAAELNPNSAIACGVGGNVHAWAGNSTIAIERCTRAMRLSPRDPWTFLFFAGIGFAHLTERRLDEALIWLNRAHQENPTGPLILAALVSTYAHLGKFDEAREPQSRLLSLGTQTASWSRRFEIFKNPVDRDFVCEGLRMAGVPGA